MATRVADDARRVRASLPRAFIALTKSEEKEGLLAVYSIWVSMYLARKY